MEWAKSFLWIGFGGAVGTWCRYLFVLGSSRLFGVGFPYGTLLVNVLGSFLIVVVAHASLAGGYVSPQLRTVLLTGFLGGLTTYSSFNAETIQLFEERSWSLGALNFFVMSGCCLVAGALGLALARQWLPLR